MSLRKHAFTLLAVSLLLFTVQGCKWFEVTIRIPDYDSRKVQGVWMWRKDVATGQWQRAGQIVFQSSTSPGSQELSYLVIQPDGTQLPLKAPIERDPKAPDQATVRLWYSRALDPGEYRVSSYNQSGESSLSPQSLELL
jgi:hypothetical protein